MNASFYVSSSSFKTFLLSPLFRYVMLVATVVMELELLNKNKLNGVHVYIYIYISSNTTIFFVVCLLILRHNYIFWPSMLAVLQVVHEELINN